MYYAKYQKQPDMRYKAYIEIPHLQGHPGRPCLSYSSALPIKYTPFLNASQSI